MCIYLYLFFQRSLTKTLVKKTPAKTCWESPSVLLLHLTLGLNTYTVTKNHQFYFRSISDILPLLYLGYETIHSLISFSLNNCNSLWYGLNICVSPNFIH